MNNIWPISMATVVVTSSYITSQRLPVRLVSREVDEEQGELWQFHADNGDFRPEVMHLVSLGQILALEPGLQELASLPMGHTARRADTGATWTVAPDVP